MMESFAACFGRCRLCRCAIDPTQKKSFRSRGGAEGSKVRLVGEPGNGGLAGLSIRRVKRPKAKERRNSDSQYDQLER